MSNPITAEEARQHLDYNPETGAFTWLIPSQGRKAMAGGLGSSGYVTICVNGKPCPGHRLAWLMTHGELPPRGMDVDHINGDRNDNRINNLRLATRSENLRNAKLSKRNATGAKGVFWNTQRNKYHAGLHLSGKRFYVGAFDTVAAAEAAIKDARELLHGEFCRHA